MKNTILMFAAAMSLSLTLVSCDGGSKGVASSATPPATDPVVAGSQCEPWQVYVTSLSKCLNIGNCPNGMGYNPADGRCYQGTVASAIPTGTFDNGIDVVDQAGFQKLMRDLGRCQWQCPTADWAYLQIAISANNDPYFTSGYGQQPQIGIPGYYDSSYYHTQQSGQWGGQSRLAQIRLYSAAEYYGGTTVQLTSRAFPKQNGFEVLVNGVGGTHAYNQRIRFVFEYANSARTLFNASIIYKDKVVAQGQINKQ